MSLEYNTNPIEYKKVDGIYEPEENLTKWQKFVLHFGEFLGKGLFGRWEFKFKIKF